MVFGVRYAILYRRYCTCLLCVEVSELWRVPDVECDILVQCNSGCCRIRSPILSNVHEYHFVRRSADLNQHDERNYYYKFICCKCYFAETNFENVESSKYKTMDELDQMIACPVPQNPKTADTMP